MADGSWNLARHGMNGGSGMGDVMKFIDALLSGELCCPSAAGAGARMGAQPAPERW
jgi:hypothetical protein